MSDTTDLGFLPFDEFLRRRSATLIQDPKAVLDQEFEVHSYLSKFDTTYRSQIESLSSLDSQPILSTVRVIVTIIAYNEGSRIRKTLENYVTQDIDPGLFEIIVLDNHPQSVERDNTFSEIQRFKAEHPSMPIVYAHKAWSEGEYATVGNARRHVFDIALMRLSKQARGAPETSIVSNDADTVSFDANYLSSIVEEFDAHQATDALVTLNVIPLKAFIKPNMYAVCSLWDALDECVGVGEPYNLIGRSSAIRSSICAAVGGYNPRNKIAEDLEIGWLIADARDWNATSVIQLKNTKHILNPRRHLMAMASRIPINEMYYDFVAKPEIRNADNDALLSYIPNELDWELFQEDADSFWGGKTTGMYKWRGDRFTADFAQAMAKIGAEFEIIDNRVRLLNIDRLLRQYAHEFDETPVVIHSQERAANPTRQAEMQNYFSSIADSMMAARSRLAQKIAFKIRSLKAEGGAPETDSLLKEYERLAGTDYSDGQIT